MWEWCNGDPRVIQYFFTFTEIRDALHSVAVSHDTNWDWRFPHVGEIPRGWELYVGITAAMYFSENNANRTMQQKQ